MSNFGLKSNKLINRKTLHDANWLGYPLLDIINVIT